MLKLACVVFVFAASTHAGAVSLQEKKVTAKAQLPCQVAMQSGDLSSKNYSKKITRVLSGVGDETKQVVAPKAARATK